jgi:polygalacturonase
MAVFIVTDFGAVGDGKFMNTAVIESILQKIDKDGGGEVVFPPGRYLTGFIKLRSNLTITLQQGAVLQATADISDYFHDTGIDLSKNFFCHYFICGFGISNITIRGCGEIHGCGRAFWHDEYYCGAKLGELPEDLSVLHYNVLKPVDTRPVTLYLAACTGIHLTDVTIREAAAYTVWTVGCWNVNIDGITIRNPPYGPNTDALDIDCSDNVVIRNCDIEAGDDCVALKSDFHRLGCCTPCENILVKNCRFRSSTCAIRIGYEGDAPIHNVTVRNTVIENSRHGIDILSIAPVCKLQIDHGTPMDNFTFNRIRMNDVGQALFIWAGNEAPRKDYGGHIRSLSFLDMEILALGSSFIGSESPGSIDGVTFSNFRMHVADSPAAEAVSDFTGMPSHWGGWTRAGGLHLHNIRPVLAEDCNITCAQPGFLPLQYS